MADVKAFHDSAGAEAIAFGRQFASSEAFKALFREGMTLVEDAAAYLDGPGRDHSRVLPRLSALTYANESMRLTTRLMQLASWLLVQRAVAEGEMSTGDASGQLSKMRIHRNEPPLAREQAETLPEPMVALIEQSLRLQSRVQHLDSIINADKSDAVMTTGRNAVALQHMLLKSAFTRTNQPT
jgi:regulator of CtrA degradation